MAEGWGLRVWGLGSQIQGFRFRAWSLGFGIKGFGVWRLGIEV